MFPEKGKVPCELEVRAVVFRKCPLVEMGKEFIEQLIGICFQEMISTSRLQLVRGGFCLQRGVAAPVGEIFFSRTSLTHFVDRRFISPDKSDSTPAQPQRRKHGKADFILPVTLII
ncbi:MAG: hypothetical protein IPP46_06105 [Bacteroidetes bacterium]|nr:hypothetical protein [Bacteroidota bacterium]